MKTLWVAAIVVCLALCSGAWAQFTVTGSGLSPRSMGMGGVGIGIADDGAAMFQNPAGLSSLSVVPQEGKEWGTDAIGNYMKVSSDFASDDPTLFNLSAATFKPAEGYGFGAGYLTYDAESYDVKMYGAGAARRFGGINLGASITRSEISDPLTEGINLINIGGLYRAPGAKWSLGLVARDVTNQTDRGPWYDAGIAIKLGRNLLIAADALDVTTEIYEDSLISFGAEYAFAPQWKARLGSFDTGDGSDITGGLGFAWNNWRIDAAYIDDDGGSIWNVGVGTSF